LRQHILCSYAIEIEIEIGIEIEIEIEIAIESVFAVVRIRTVDPCEVEAPAAV